ncbi:hypothetical protein CHH48_16620 [Terribacillus saccharophilus]|uniref:ABC transmembrane type-1 domain-containing protein n=2 Tax=Terribacillus saccharophilus TaxID=361277 RepID=A0ABX4GUM9_9BACI|nr:hypothetical protein CHH56_15520 [Terribacillus saccharophilus]PAD94828.1 hypothetical protein CHH50_16610 [Terribacillus saccharophilus]PAD98577.1 hypothetical protein CHH48_16620 [Terribacillus saccharophilus]
MWTGVVICFEQNKITNITSKEEKPFQSYQRYLRILYREKKLFFSVIFLSILISLIAFLGAWIYKIVIDNYILNEPISDGFVPKDFNFIALIISLLIFYLFQTALSLIKNIFNAKAVKSLSNKLSESFLQHLIKIPPKSLSRFETGEILSRFQSISEIQQSYLIVILTLTTEIIGALVGGIILFSLSHQ